MYALFIKDILSINVILFSVKNIHILQSSHNWSLINNKKYDDKQYLIIKKNIDE